MNNKWLAAVAMVFCSTGVAAGEFTMDVLLGGTDVHMDGEFLSGGEDHDRGLLTSGISLGHVWATGPRIELGIASSADILPWFGWADLKHTWIAAGWRFGPDHAHFTPKIGLTHSQLRTLEEDIHTGGEPVDEMKDLVPFAELAAEYRFGGRFGLGGYWRRNFEQFGRSSTVGITLGWSFH